MNARSRFLRVFEAVLRGSGLSVGVAAFLIGVFVTYEVLIRELARQSEAWVTEVTTYLMGYITFVGAAYALYEGAHVAVDVVVKQVPAGTRRLLRIVSDGVVIAVLGALTWLSAEFWWEAWSTGERSPSLLSVPLWIPYLFFTVGMAWLLFTQIALSTLAFLRRERESDIPPAR